ncbi:hypothetical protein ACI01nite_19610 [Acetobacter cibinongensis]|uniref:Uncharacterized protein n=1 Tax=Acetobacter cibinongensis TaxID=146475 RepID=A0A0D6N2U0_9PROT|nr:hypothetical protein Abci_007_239 [Acetobacter cibinongensis]GBQ14774.1 hypothetical protein AA0482_1011 [Acetobacter cibinongensis NRIC 0482]GEL59359.1 hypothetical protein ACI01nite_19610 [Acetobacter cibinongensis]
MWAAEKPWDKPYRVQLSVRQRGLGVVFGPSPFHPKGVPSYMRKGQKGEQPEKEITCLEPA